MKIAVYHNLPSGGAKRALYEQLKHTLKFNEYDVYTLSNSGSEKFLDLSRIIDKNFRFPFKETKLKFLPDFIIQLIRLRSISKTQKKIANVIDSKNYDLVYVAHCMYTQSPMILSYMKTKSLYYVQEPRRATYDPEMKVSLKISFNPFKTAKSIIAVTMNNIYSRIDRNNIAKANLRVCNSRFSQQNINSCYGLDAKVCYLGINTTTFKPAKVKKQNMVLSVGAAHPLKGHLEVLKALGLIDEVVRPKLNIVYDRKVDSYIDELNDTAKKMNVTCILNQDIKDNELVDLYRKAAFSVSAAHNEPFGFGPLESIACGTPVVARNEGGFKETVIDGVNGVFYDGKLQDLQGKMEMIINNKFRFDGAKESRNIQRKWSWGKSAENLQKFFVEVYEK